MNQCRRSRPSNRKGGVPKHPAFPRLQQEKLSEAETDACQHLMTVETGFIVAVAIFGQRISVGRNVELTANAQVDTVRTMLTIRQVKKVGLVEL